MNGIGNLLTNYALENLARGFRNSNHSGSRPRPVANCQIQNNEAVKVEPGKDNQKCLVNAKAHNPVLRAPKSNPQNTNGHSNVHGDYYGGVFLGVRGPANDNAVENAGTGSNTVNGNTAPHNNQPHGDYHGGVFLGSNGPANDNAVENAGTGSNTVNGNMNYRVSGLLKHHRLSDYAKADGNTDRGYV